MVVIIVLGTVLISGLVTGGLIAVLTRLTDANR